MKVISRPPGGLGNQLFSFVAAYYFAQVANSDLQIDLDNTDKKYGRDAILELAVELGIPVVTHRADRFIGRKARKFMQSRFERLKARYYKIFKHVFIADSPYMHDERSTERTNKVFETLLYTRPSKVTIDTYSQDFFYLNKLCELKKCKPRDLLGLGSYKQLDDVNQEFCTVHIRLGDAIENKESFGVLTEEYYSQSMQLLNKENPELEFEIFSDDIQMARELYKSLEKFNITWKNSELLSSANPMKDLLNMARNRNFILSNSTFSFWSAKLAGNVSKVIFPKPMYRSSKFEGVRNLPSNWIAAKSTFM